MKCNNCGTSNLKGAKFCEKCGFSLSETGICPKCGHKNKPAALHCIECGTALAQTDLKPPKPVDVDVPKEEPIKPKKGISPVIWVLGGVFGVIILCVAAFLLGLIKVPVPPEPDTSILPEFIVSAWKNTYQFQTTGSFSPPASSSAQVPLQGGYVEALFNCDEKGKSPVSATTQDKIYDYIKWGAGTQVQSEDFLKYVKFDVTVNGNPANYQGPFMGEISFEQEKLAYSSTPLVVIPDLAVGTHHIQTKVTWSQKFYDGEAYYGPGSGNEQLVGNCTVVITNSASKSPQKDEAIKGNILGEKACTPLLVMEDCFAKAGIWTTNLFTGEVFCTCNANDPKGECIINNGMWFENKHFCSYRENPFPVCIPNFPKENCEVMDATWQTNEKTGEGYCVCDKKDPRNECQIYDGKWDDTIQKCSFTGGIADGNQVKSGCPDLMDVMSGSAVYNKEFDQLCISRGGYIDVSRNADTIDCMCPDATTVQPTCPWNNENINGNQIGHAIDCNTYKNRCVLGILPFEFFKEIPNIVIKLKNGKSISSSRAGTGVVACSKGGQNDWACELLNNESIYGVPEMKGEEDIQDIYVCAGLCCVDLKKLESGSGPLLGLTNNCPLSGELDAEITEWKAGALTLKLKNTTAEWPVSAFPTQLYDGAGKPWVKLDCKRKSDDNKVMTCKGSGATIKTGSATMSFSYSGGGASCSIPSLKFPIPPIKIPSISHSCPSGEFWCSSCNCCSISC